MSKNLSSFYPNREGPQGDMGWQGFQGGGFQGYQGDGFQGYQGYIGWQGEGFQGFIGPQGYRGYQSPSESGVWTTENDVTTDQSPTTSNMGELYRFTSSTTADKTLTLPTMSSGEDGDYLWIQNASSYIITVKPDSADSVWRNGNGYGLEMRQQSIVCLKYNYGNNNWIPVNKSGGIKLEGVVMHLTGELGVYSGSGTPSYSVALDELGENPMYTSSTVISTTASDEDNIKYSTPYLIFDGLADCLFHNPGTLDIYDFLGSTSGSYTFSTWLKPDGTGASKYICTHYEDVNNRWYIQTGSDNSFKFAALSGGATVLSLAGGTITTNWQHVAAVRVGSEVGIYVNGQQVDYVSTFTPDTYNGSLVIAQKGNSTTYYATKMSDIVLTQSNIYNAAPQSDDSDTLKNWDGRFSALL